MEKMSDEQTKTLPDDILEYLSRLVYSSEPDEKCLNELPKRVHDHLNPEAKELDELYKEVEETYEDYNSHVIVIFLQRLAKLKRSIINTYQPIYMARNQ